LLFTLAELLDSRRSSVPRWLPIAVLACALAGPAGADSLEQRVELDEGALLRIELDLGRVEVATHAAHDVRIEARAAGLGASGVRFALEESDRALVLRGRAEPWLAFLRGGPRVLVRVWVPPEYHVDQPAPDAAELQAF
jgi:hypothetical protein